MALDIISRDDLLTLLGDSETFQMTGSRYICNPAPTDTDEDWIALDLTGKLQKSLCAAGFAQNTDQTLYDGMPDFWSYRLGEFNVVVTDNMVFYDRFVAATELAKLRNLLIKADRISLFQSIIYGNN